MDLNLPNPGKPVLRGGNVVLRPITRDDAGAMFAGLSDREAIRLTGTRASFAIGDIDAHCARVAVADDRWDYAITVVGQTIGAEQTIGAGQMIGEVVLNEFDRDNRSANIRIVIWSAQARGRGLGTEAMSLLTRFAFAEVGLHRVELGVYAFNPRAVRCYEKVGFIHEGTRRAALWWEGEWIDQHIMAMVAP